MFPKARLLYVLLLVVIGISFNECHPRYLGEEEYTGGQWFKSKVMSTCSQGEVMADPYNCTKFYLCQFEQWAPMLCHTGYSFDYISKECVLSNYSYLNCAPSNYPTTPATTPKPPEACYNEGEKRGMKGYCSEYEECLGGKWTVQSCNGWAFNNVSLSCSWLFCFGTDGFHCDVEGMIKASPSCYEYYQCLSNVWTLQHCIGWGGIQYMYDPVHLECSWMVCPEQQSTPSWNTPITPRHTTETTTTTTTTPTTTTTTTAEPCPPGMKTPVKSDCLKYMECDDGVFVEKTCGVMQKFNPDTMSCEYTRDIKC